MYDVGIVTTHITPAVGFGGVLVSGARLAAAWAGVSSRKIALCSSDASDNGAICVEDVRLGENVTVNLYRAYWFKRWGFGPGAFFRLMALCRQSQAVYINGIATWPTTLAAMICCVCRRPFVIAPRGGLMPEHVAHIRKNRPAKWAYYRLLTFPWIKRAKALHCTGQIEAAGARACLGDVVPIVIAPNGLPLPVQPPASSSVEKGLVLAYVGRISHEKGVNTFLRIWVRVRGPNDRFVVAGASSGAGEAIYFKEFQNIVSQSEGAITYRGYLNGSEVNKLIADSHFLVLPSGLDGDIRENFGIVVAEALALGRPAMVCRGLEWDDIEDWGAGLVFDRNTNGVTAALHRASTLKTECWRRMAESARRYAEQRLDIRVTAEQVWRAVAEHDGPKKSRGYRPSGEETL